MVLVDIPMAKGKVTTEDGPEKEGPKFYTAINVPIDIAEMCRAIWRAKKRKQPKLDFWQMMDEILRPQIAPMFEAIRADQEKIKKLFDRQAAALDE